MTMAVIGKEMRDFQSQKMLVALSYKHPLACNDRSWHMGIVSEPFGNLMFDSQLFHPVACPAPSGSIREFRRVGW